MGGDCTVVCLGARPAVLHVSVLGARTSVARHGLQGASEPLLPFSWLGGGILGPLLLRPQVQSLLHVGMKHRNWQAQERLGWGDGLTYFCGGLRTLGFLGYTMVAALAKVRLMAGTEVQTLPGGEGMRTQGELEITEGKIGTGDTRATYDLGLKIVTTMDALETWRTVAAGQESWLRGRFTPV